MQRTHGTPQRGAALILSIYVVTVLSILSLSMTTRGLNEHLMTRHALWDEGAFHLADAGLDASMSAIRAGNLSGPLASTGMGAGDYWTDAFVPLGGNLYQITAHGRTTEPHERQLEAVVEATPLSVFQYPLFGDQLLDLRGNVETDSYDSTLGAYGACLSDCTGANPVYNIGSNGDLGTNATYSNATTSGPATSGLALSGSSVIINGQMNFGVGTTDPTYEYEQHSITGSANPLITASPDAVAMSDPLLLPPVTVPAYLTCTDLPINSFETVTLPPGEYCYHDVTMGAPDALGAYGPAVLEVTGEVTIYITGNFQASAQSFIGNTATPSYTVIQLASPQGAMVTSASLAGTTQLYGAIYAPDSHVTLAGTVDIYGSITAYSIRQTGDVQVHYDEGLQDRDDIIGGYLTHVEAWREL